MRLNVHTRSPFYCKHALCAGIIPLGYHLAAGSYVRESTFRWLIPDELRLIPFVTTAADMHPAARHEHMGSPSGRCSAPLGARLLPLEAKGFRRRGRAPTQELRGKRHQSPAICARFREALGGARAAAPWEGCRGFRAAGLGVSGRFPARGGAPRFGRGRRFAGAAVRDVGGARAARAGMRPETGLSRRAAACRGVPLSGVIVRPLRPVCNATKGL